MYDAEVRPRLHSILPPRFITKRMLRIALVPESTVDARVAPIYKGYSDVETTILAHNGEIQLHFQYAGVSLNQAQARVDEVASRCEQEIASPGRTPRAVPASIARSPRNRRCASIAACTCTSR